MTTEQTVRRYLLENNLISPGDRVTVAVSGGADSMALLSILLRLRESLQITVSAAHYHHGLRGAEADRDEAFVRGWCEAHSVPLTVGHGDVRARAAQTGESIEEAARNLRYAFFDTLDASEIATAHTANDNAETLLLHLLRGTGPRGLCGIPAARGRYIRPLLQVTREQLEAYLTEQHIDHIEDSTNAEDNCVRNRIRHEIMPLLLRENPRFLFGVTRTTELQTQEDAYISRLAAEAAETCRIAGGFSCEMLRSLHPVLRRRILLGELRRLGVENPASCYLEALEGLLFTKDPSASVDLPQSLQARREYDKLLFTPADTQTFSPVCLPVPGSAELPGLGVTAVCSVIKNSYFVDKKADKICLKYDMITRSVFIRPRKAGDRLTLPGGTKTLKKLMIDRKIPAHLREQLPVIEISGEVAAVKGLGIGTAFLPEAGQPTLVIEFQRR